MDVQTTTDERGGITRERERSPGEGGAEDNKTLWSGLLLLYSTLASCHVLFGV